MPKGLAIGIDLGGTKIRTGLVNGDGCVVGECATVPTEAETSAATVIRNLAASVDRVLERAGLTRAEVRGVGVGSPGPLDLEHGLVLNPLNLPALHNYPLRDRLAAALGLPVALNNDGNVFALGEAIGGAGRGHRYVYGVTLGTGFGSGFVIDGHLYNGATGTAGEIWCFPYREGIIEDYVSGRGLTAIHLRRTGERRRPKEIADAARAQEMAAIETMREFGHHLGMALAYVVNVVDPGIVVVGGSIIADWELYVDAMEAALRPNINTYPRERLRVSPAALGAEAAVVGAAALVAEVAGAEF